MMFGNYRINTRDISWKRRLVGECKTAGDRLDELCLISRKKRKLHNLHGTLNLFLINHLLNDENGNEGDDDDDEIRNLLALTILLQVRSIIGINRQLATIQFVDYQPIERMLRIDINIDFLPDADFKDQLGFSKEQVILLYNVLNIPVYFIIDAHLIHSKWKVDGLKRFLQNKIFRSNFHSSSTISIDILRGRIRSKNRSIFISSSTLILEAGKTLGRIEVPTWVL